MPYLKKDIRQKDIIIVSFIGTKVERKILVACILVVSKRCQPQIPVDRCLPLIEPIKFSRR